MSENQIRYRSNTQLNLDAVIRLYRASTLGERRPVDDRETMAAMIENANLVITAWDGEQLVGIARSLTDWVYVTYLSDLAVDVAYQRRGIGTRLVAETRRLGGANTKLVLLSAPAAVDYYPRIGFERHPAAYIM